MSTDRVRFGPFDFDRTTGEIWNAGRPVKLQEKPRQILVALLEQPGALVSRESLRRRLWDEDLFVDFDNGLNVAVRKIREALGDLTSPPRYVETVRGQGYRFIADVVVPDSLAQPVKRERRWSIPSARWVSLAATAVVALVAATFIAMRPTQGDSTVHSIAVLPFGNHLGGDTSLTVDGFSEALTASLAARLQLPVIASQSAFSLRDDMADLHAVAARLGVDAVVVGAVERDGTRVVISARLVDADSLRTRWSGRFERTTLDDL